MPLQKIDKMPTKLEQLQLQFRQKLMQEKEERMIKIHTDSQQKALSKVTRYDNNIPQVPAAVSVTKKPPTTYPSQPHQSPIKKGSPGVDRSRPLPPLQKEQKNHYNNKVSPSSTPGEIATKTVNSNGSRSRSVDLEVKNVGRPSVNGRLKQRTDSNHSLEVDSYSRADPERISTNVDYLAKLRQAELQRIRSNGKLSSENAFRHTNGHYTASSSKSSVEQKSSPSVASRQPSSSRPKPRAQAPTVQKRSPPTKTSVSSGNPPARKPPNPNQEQCKQCGRNFNKDRIDKHISICLKTSQKKRKVFDVTKMRVSGTEAERFVKKGISAKEQPKPKKTNWKKQHEEFIATIRQAKEVQRHLAAGGKVSDLPPPPPSDTSHYVPCPYCGRKFDGGVAERHIPKCKNIISNKKPLRK